MNVTNSDRTYIYGSIQFYKTQKCITESNRYLGKSYSDKKKNALSEKVTGNSILIQNAYERMSGSTRKISGANLLAQTMSGNTKAENEQYMVEKSDEIAGYWCIYDKQCNHYFTFNPMTTDLQMDEKTGSKYLIASDEHGGLVDAMSVDQSLFGVLKKFMGVKDIAANALNERYIVDKNQFTGIECLKVKGAEGNGSWLMVRGKEQLQELADIYKSQYPHLVKTEGLAMGFAQAEAAGQAFRTPNGIMMISCNGMEYMDNTEASKSWAVQYPVNASNMYTEIMKAMTDGYIYGDDIEDFSKWKKYFEEKNLEYEKILSDDELAAASGEKETETKSDIIVKPDGSRVLVVTMNIGGMETTMSLEISKPTDMPNDNSKQDNENSSIPDTQADTVSEEMSGTVSEA